MNLFFVFFVPGAIALRMLKFASQVIPKPKVTRFQDIHDAELSIPDMQATHMKYWNVTIMTYPLHDVISRTLQKDGTWEAKAVKKACKYYQSHGAKGNMLDVGSNIGAFALPLAMCLKNNSSNKKNILISVEAMKKNSQKMRASIKWNKLDNIRLYEYAVTEPDANDTVAFHEESGNKGHSHVVTGRKVMSDMEYEVPATTIDAIAEVEGDAMKRIFFMKMDIEGHEPAALKGAEKFMKDGPCLIFVELNNIHVKPILEKLGYVETEKGNGTGGEEGWFQHENMSTCIAKL